MPRLADPVDLVILIPDTFDLRAEFRTPLMPRRSFGRIREARQAVVICRRRNRRSRVLSDQWRSPAHPADRLDAVDNALIFNEGDHRFSGRSSSACAK